MRKKVLQLEVSTTSDRTVCIAGPEDHGHDDCSPIVEVHLDQIDTLVGWLMEAKEELIAQGN